jgi:hypothetical protein
MHPEDENEFARIITSEDGTVFVDGPIWHQARPPITREILTAGNHLMIWNPSETPDLVGTYRRKDEKEWWYCDNEFLTIQFLRSGFQFGEPFLFEGRIAVCTTAKDKSYFHEASAAAIELRFKKLRKYIKKCYTNEVIIWQALSFSRSKTNPLKPDSSVWVGSYALQWLEEEPRNRWVQQFRNAGARGYLLDLIK